jgi:hypothetical protein
MLPNLLTKNLLPPQKEPGNTDVLMCELLRISTQIMMFFLAMGMNVLYTQDVIAMTIVTM